ncbi:baseplate J/gp47 family protein [uncultured Dysosmobacter sp.]|uniref:baseplate assembly protein n=1 Tax=uncultured Dysosmobacter sp. TaxID=2591384 RepID=UPI00260AB5B7|nr:baseplate J/gp47 family protein [uncultured Dysosmobacter sp.]
MSKTLYQFIPMDPDEITAWMTEQYESITGVTVQPGSPERQFIQWAAAVVLQERALANYAANQNLPSRAEGKDLDALAELFYAKERPGAKAATCTMRFTISEAQEFAVLIPGGTRVTDASRTLVWETVEDIYVNAGDTYADVEIRCQTEGTAGNGFVAGQINTIVDLFAYYISCANLTASDGGGDAATDEEFYELLRLSMDGYSCAGARGGYIYFAKQVDTKIADVIAASPTPGTVKLYVLMDDGTIATEETKKKVLEACSADDVRPLTDLVSVEDPEKVKYNVTLTYYIQKDETQSAEDLDAAVKAKVDEFTAWQSAKLGRDINPSRLISMLMQTGIKRVELTEPAFTSLKDGSGTEAPQVAELGTVTVQSGGYEDE